MEPSPPEIAQSMKRFYESLSAKDQRRYAGIEALKYGHGGRSSIARVLGCSRRTVSKGAKEVSQWPKAEVDRRMRIPGGGRTSSQESWVDIDEKFLHVLHDHTAGDPMDATVRWTDLTVGEIGKALQVDHGIPVSQSVVRTLLKKHNSRRRKAHKKQTMKAVPHRNEPCENMQRLKAEEEAAGNPMVSMDTKKKAYVGNFSREGHGSTLEALRTYDPDCNSFAEGVIIPHSL